MDQIKDLITFAVHLSKGISKGEQPAVLDVWEKAIAEVTNYFKDNEAKKQLFTDDNDIIVTLTIPPKRKRGRPRKDQTEQLKIISQQVVAKTEDDQTDDTSQLIRQTDSAVSAPRTSKRAIVPSKRFPTLYTSIVGQKSAVESCNVVKENMNLNSQGDTDRIKEVSVSDRIKEVSVSDNTNNPNHCGDENKRTVSPIKTFKKPTCDLGNDTDEDGEQQVEKDAKKCMRMKKTSSSNKTDCAVCGKAFTNRSNLLVHMRLHDGRKPYSCSECGKTFAVLSNKKRHEKSHSGAKPFSCSQCSKQFSAKRSLDIHMRQHTGERPYKCKYCEKAFSQTGTLQSHLHIHEGIRKYLCDLCGKSFRQRTQMKIHLLRHEVCDDPGKKQFKCSLCTEKFVSRSDRDRHIVKHSGFRPFLCSHCPKSFTRMAYLNEHIKRSHYNVPPYLRKCKLCDYQTEVPKKFNDHMKKHERSGEQELTTAAWKELLSSDGSKDNEETVIFVVDQSTVDNLYMRNSIDHTTPIVAHDSVLNAGSNQVALLQNGIQVIQESQIDNQPCQTIVITEEQLAQLQHVRILEAAVENHVNQSASLADVKSSTEQSVSLKSEPKVSLDKNNTFKTLEPGEIPASDLSQIDKELADEATISDETATEVKVKDAGQ